MAIPENSNSSNSFLVHCNPVVFIIMKPYFERRKYDGMSKIRDKIKPLLTIIVPVALILLASAMITGCGEDPLPLAENTAESSSAIENTESPAIYETTATEPPTPPPFDPKNVEIVENPTDSSMSSPLIYTTWEGLDFSNLLRYEIDYYKNQPDKYNCRVKNYFKFTKKITHFFN